MRVSKHLSLGTGEFVELRVVYFADTLTERGTPESPDRDTQQASDLFSVDVDACIIVPRHFTPLLYSIPLRKSRLPA